MKFRLLDTGYNNGFFNMAVDETIMHFVRQEKTLPTIRFYQWRPSCLSIGYFQGLSEIDIDNCKKFGVDIVRRITGGKAVLHNEELTYSIIAPEGLFPRSIIESYKIISTPISETLRRLGLNATLKSNNIKKTSSPICFHESSYYEINVNNRKIVGSAQARLGGVLLQHGSILLDLDAKGLCALFNISNNAQEVKKTWERGTSLNKESKRAVGLIEIKSVLIKNFEDALDIELAKGELTEEELWFAREKEEEYRDV